MWSNVQQQHHRQFYNVVVSLLQAREGRMTLLCVDVVGSGEAISLRRCYGVFYQIDDIAYAVCMKAPFHGVLIVSLYSIRFCFFFCLLCFHPFVSEHWELASPHNKTHSEHNFHVFRHCLRRASAIPHSSGTIGWNLGEIT